MPPPTKDQLIAQISQMDEVPETVRKQWLNSVEKASAVDFELLDWLRTAMQNQIDATYNEIGVKDDENDPEFKQRFEQMLTEIEAAKNEFQTTMEQLQKEAQQVQEKTSKQLDDIQIQEVQDRIKQGAATI